MNGANYTKYDPAYTKNDSLENSVSITFSCIITIFPSWEGVYEQKNSLNRNYFLSYSEKYNWRVIDRG